MCVGVECVRVPCVYVQNLHRTPGWFRAVGCLPSAVCRRLFAVSRVRYRVYAKTYVACQKQAFGSPQMSLVRCRVCPDMRELTDTKGFRRPSAPYAWLRMSSHTRPGGIFRATGQSETGQLDSRATGRSGSQAIRQLDSQAVKEPISQYLGPSTPPPID